MSVSPLASTSAIETKVKTSGTKESSARKETIKTQLGVIPVISFEKNGYWGTDVPICFKTESL